MKRHDQGTYEYLRHHKSFPTSGARAAASASSWAASCAPCKSWS